MKTEANIVPITHGGTDRGYKLCKCSKCGAEEVCTPRRDFYTLRGDTKGPLHCEDCFRKWCATEVSK